MILQRQNDYFYFSRTVSILQTIFKDKRGKPSSGIWKDVHISLLASQKMKADLFFVKQKESTKFIGEGKNAYFWLVTEKLLLTSQNN